MGEENRVENLGQVGYRWLGKMLQYAVRDIVRALSLADLETSDGFLNIGIIWVRWEGPGSKTSAPRQPNQ
jgi:hypothetical protein